MEVLQVLHMNKGDGETSYAKNSTVQSKIISIAKPITQEAVLQLLCTNIPDSIGIADLGCSCGPNVFLVISEVINTVYSKCHLLGRPTPEFRVYLNDLPSNDFNDIFGSLPAFYNTLKEQKGSGFGPCFISGVPGSFYGRLFPRNSLHFVHSSSSLHWLSQVVMRRKTARPVKTTILEQNDLQRAPTTSVVVAEETPTIKSVQR